MATKKRANGITLKTVLDHIQHQHHEVLDRFDRFEKRMERMERWGHGFEKSVETRLFHIDERLSIIEISIVEQQHENRIRRLESHAGFVQSSSDDCLK